jgi:hypothetical protein
VAFETGLTYASIFLVRGYVQKVERERDSRPSEYLSFQCFLPRRCLFYFFLCLQRASLARAFIHAGSHTIQDVRVVTG